MLLVLPGRNEKSRREINYMIRVRPRPLVYILRVIIPGGTNYLRVRFPRFQRTNRCSIRNFCWDTLRIFHYPETPHIFDLCKAVAGGERLNRLGSRFSRVWWFVYGVESQGVVNKESMPG